jgi:hypothetical protein
MNKDLRRLKLPIGQIKVINKFRWELIEETDKAWRFIRKGKK